MTETPPNNGDQTMTNPGNGDQPMTNPGNGDQTMTETPPNQGDQPMTNPGKGDQTMTNPNREDQTMTNPGNGDQTMEDIFDAPSSFNLETAETYLKTLDPLGFTVDDPFTFAAFSDPAEERGGITENCLHGTLDEKAAQLRALNARNAGIFVMPNAGDGAGRKTSNVTQVRAVWQDDDNDFRGTFPLRPTLTVETSPGRYQRLWVCHELTFAEHEAVQRRLAQDYGHDPQASGLNRVLRLPGFWHCKHKRFLVRLEAPPGEHYSREQLLDAFPPLEKAQRAVHRVRTPLSSDAPAIERIADALGWLDSSERGGLGEAGIETWWAVGAALQHDFGDDGRDLWDAWSSGGEWTGPDGSRFSFAPPRPHPNTGCSPFNPADQDRTWADYAKRAASRSGNPITSASIIAKARENGWQDAWAAERDFEERREADEGGGDGAAEDGSAGADAGAKLRRRFNTPEFRFPDDPVWANRERAKVRTAAIERDVSPEALLMLMLARLSAKVPYTWRARTRGRRTVLNTFVALIGVSGGGNSEALKAADELIPDSPGMTSPAFKTGEGLRGDFFGEGKDRGKRVCWNVFSSSDEGSLLKETAHGSGATALGVLNSLWSGAKAGGSTRTSGRQTLAAGTYSLGVAFRLHPENAGYVLSQIGNGAAQRFICVNGHRLLDQEIPDQREVTAADFAEHLDFGPPRDLDAIEPPAGLFDGAGGDGNQHTEQAGGPEPVDIVFPDDLAAEAKRMSDEAFKKATDEGKKHEIDSQAAAVLIKLSALLAIFSGRRKATWDDWRAAKAIWDCSKRVRDAVLQWEQEQSRQELKRKASGQASFESEVSEKKYRAALKTVIGRAARQMDEGRTPCTEKGVYRAMKAHHLKLVSAEDVFAAMIERGLIEEADGGKYRRTARQP